MDTFETSNNFSYYVAGAKVNLNMKWKQLIGYVVDESYNILKIRVTVEDRNEIVQVNRPAYDSK